MVKDRAKTETLVGSFILVGLLMLGGLALQFGNIMEWAKGKYSMTVDFKEATGVIKGSSVRMLGAKVGEVASRPELMESAKVRVTLSIEDKFNIPKGSVFQIAGAGFLGDKEIIITPPEEETTAYIEAGSQLKGGGPSGLELIQADAESIAEDARILMKDARTAMVKMDSSLDDIRAVAIRLSESIEIINDGVLSDANVTNLSSAIAHFEKATKSAAELGDDAGPVMAEARLAIQDIREAVVEIKSAAGSAHSAIQKVSPALERVPQTLASIEKTVDQAGAAIENVQKGDGALAAITSNQETKEDTQTFIRNLRKYGILRYKDKETEEDDPRERFSGRRR